MNIIRTSRNIAIIALILSLLFHGTTIFYIFSQKTRNAFAHILDQHEQKQHITQQPQPEKQKNNTEWVETRARAGNFGAPVFFEDTPEKPEQVSEEKELELEQEYPQPKLEQEQEKQVTQSQLPEAINQSPEKSTASHTTTTQPQAKTQIQKASTSQHKKAPGQKKQSHHTTFAHSTPKPPITLAQLTQGFLHHRKGVAGTQHRVSMIGMKQGIPSDMQMKYERYLEKLDLCLQNSFKIHARKIPCRPTNTYLYLLFTLDRNGTLTQLSIQKSSGNRLLDDFGVFIFRDASASFPPIPGYLPDDPFQMTCGMSCMMMAYF